MALGFNSNLINSNAHSVANAETAGSIASANSETAGSIAAASTETAGLIASNAAIDSFQSNNPFAPQIDYSQYSSAPETAGSVACETAGSIAFGDSAETAGSIASAGAETAGSVASSDSGFGSFDSGFVC